MRGTQWKPLLVSLLEREGALPVSTIAERLGLSDHKASALVRYYLAAGRVYVAEVKYTGKPRASRPARHIALCRRGPKGQGAYVLEERRVP